MDLKGKKNTIKMNSFDEVVHSKTPTLSVYIVR